MRTLKISRENTGYFFDSILNSYSQIFFSTHKPFAVIILVVTFYDVYAGLMGLLSVLITSTTAFALNLYKPTTAKGFYGFNSLLVGLGLGIYFSFGWHLLMIVALASLFTFFVSVSLQGVIGKYHLPYLSVPFIIALWTFITATRSFEALGISERGIYTLNELYQLGGDRLIAIHEYFNSITLPRIISTYFISLSAILFQYSVLSGIFIATGLLFYSRIAFSLSILGFAVAYVFYDIIGASITDIDYSYIGFNYILTAIALGGFFIIPSIRSYIWVIILIPMVAIITISLNNIFMPMKLPVYSLPFNMVVLLFIYILKFRSEYSYTLTEAYYQYNSPEKNLYVFLNNAERFRFNNLRQIKLPFFGIWNISQGHNGSYTHKDEWRHAWDFVINDRDGKQYKNNGDFPEDYFCYGKPVIAPDEGTIEKIVDDINDNIIGEVNLKNNWGNSIIIKHDDNIYSKLSHLKKGSITVKEGEKVSYGHIIAQCGNSGRSPYPHLHFQIQEFPFIGSATKDYPFSNYVLHEEKKYQFKSHSKPLENQKISNVEVNQLLSKAFHFTPGEILKFEVTGFKDIKEVSWEVKVNPFNETYLECSRSGAIAYFQEDENQIQFSHFEGKKDCLLYYFYLAAFKVQKGYYQNLRLKDSYPLSLVFPSGIRWFHDFISPFVRFATSSYMLCYNSIDDYMDPGEISLSSRLNNRIFNISLNEMQFELSIKKNGVDEIKIYNNDQILELKRI
ncbi:MAG TPA: urea transporter [Bacteroidales bacterium]|nr:urea transporter [Bacteroidales bacterium]